MAPTRVALAAAFALLLSQPRLACGQVVSISGDIPTLETKDIPKGTGLILGRAIDPGTNQPVTGAFVSLYMTNGGSLGAITDSAGRFVFRDLPKGKFTLRAMKSGYGYGVYGKHLPDTGLDVSNDGVPLELGDDEHRGDIVIKLWKYAAIGGVVRDEHGEPVVGITVRALGATYAGGRRLYSLEGTGGGASYTTDDRGMFRLSALIPGEYVVVVPVVTQSFPRSLARMLAAPGARPPQMFSDSSYGNTDWASSGGFVTREAVDGTDAQFALSAGARSPGIAGQTRDGRLLLYEMQFYPNGSSLALAQPIVLGSGEERSGIDFALRPTSTARISGRVTGPNGPVADLALGLARADIDAMTSDPFVAQTATDADGTFRFLGIAPGDYVLTALVAPRPVAPVAQGTTVSSGSGTTVISPGGSSRALPTEPTLWAAQRLTVGDGDVGDVSVLLQRGGRISGRVEFQGTRPPPTGFDGFYVERADGTQSKTLTLLLGVIDRNGNFSSSGQPAGKYFLRVPWATSGWYFAGAKLGDRDLSVTPIELSGADVEGVVLLFRDAPGAEISGVVRSDGGNIDYVASVVAFPVNRSLWGAIGKNPRNFKAVGVMAGGRYVVSDLPPGEYFVAPWPESRRDWSATTTLETLSRSAVRVTVSDQEKKTQDLTLPRRARAAEDESAPLDGHGPWVADEQTPAPARDQRPAAPRGSGAIAGTVVAAVGGDPVRLAKVTLSGAELLGSRIAITDDAGRFVFESVPVGRFNVSADKAAYLTTRYGATGPGRPGTPITLAEAQRVTNITLALARGGVITGVLRDDRGEPLGNAPVQLMQYRMVNGVRRLNTSSSQSPFNLTTDDRGRYRFYGVDPGEYLVAASIRSGGLSGRETTAADIQYAEDVLRRGRAAASSQAASPRNQPPPRTMVHVPVFYPGTSDPSQGRLVSVAAGQEADGIDFVVSLVAAATIRGVVNPSSADIEVRLVSATPNVGGIPFAAAFPTRPGPNGEFMFTAVAPGHHTVVATTSAVGARGGAASPRLWALAELDVAGVDISGVTLSMQPAMSVSGSIAFDATTLTPPPFNGIRVSLSPDLSVTQVSVGPSQITVNSDGTFVATGVMPGRYTLRALLPAGNTGWLVRSAMLSGKDVSETGFDVPPGENVTGLVLTHIDRPSEISGTLQDASGRPAPDYVIIVFPADKSLWRAGARRILTTRPGTDGKFTVRNLLAGSYHLAAVTDAAPGEWFDPAFLERLVPGAFAFQLAEGEKKVQDVQIRK
jgi:protocatechuate 3,4-dioxygenase beta subunit